MTNKDWQAIGLDDSLRLALPGAPVSPKKRRLFATGSVAAIAWSILQFGATGGADAQAVGDPIVNPVTNDTETITDVVENGVITDSGLFILTTTSPGQFVPDPDGAGVVEIQIALVNSTTGLVDRIQLVDGRTFDVVQVLAPTIDPTVPAFRPKPTPSDINFIAQIFEGDRGKKGRSGGAFVSARGGRAGEAGPNLPGLTYSGSSFVFDPAGVLPTIDLAGQFISTRSDGLAGVERSSIGGDGGHGGDATFSIAGGGKPGGRGGAGGVVSLIVQGGTINTTGSEAHGIVAQSRSGVGGQGGDSTLAISGAGDGGEGNDGGSVTLNVRSTTSITTRGDGSAGVLAQSLGGGAGSGGSAYNLFAWGGGAKDGGDGGNVNLTFAGQVQTFGVGAPGVFAQSLGGTGGQAGDSIGVVAFGDDGSGGGNGGSVTLGLSSTARVFTAGIASTGVFAQSVGGGGGATGTSVALGAFGASGGSGGDGGSVALTLQSGAQVETRNWFSTAVIAQSIGGGGGNGRTTVGAVALGSTGGGGGSAGDVTLNSQASIQTQGILSLGILAQSVGGGGGNAGTTVGALSLGGDGGDASHAGDVQMQVGGAIETRGALSTGVLGQSIGGGGGNGGMAVSGGVYVGMALGGEGGAGGNSQLVSLDLLPRSILVGGVEREATSVISTNGFLSRGIHLQSVGGGGGNGGMAVTGTVGLFGSAAVAIGGGGASAGDASLVRLRGDVNILTEGGRSEGIFLQSVGGGGGAGGGAIAVSAAGGPGGAASVSVAVGGNGGVGGDSLGELLDDEGNVVASGERRTAVYLDSGGLIRTRGAGSTGIFAQSVGGGGGAGGFAISAPIAASDGVAVAIGIGVGGSGAGGGNASGVDVTFDGSIRTEGASSSGALIQSVGGGGGNGDFAIVGSVAASGSFSGAVGVGVGGAAGNGGNGDVVRANILGSVETDGSGSTGVIVQSVGGGGGNGGYSIVGSITASGFGAAGVGVGVGGLGGGGGDGGAVEADVADIYTNGTGSHGAIIQSIGGGGGNGGFNVSAGIAATQFASGSISVGLGGSGGRGGDGGAVTSVFRGDFEGLGRGGTGLLAQSIGGGGGNGGFNVSAGISASRGGAGNINIGFGGSGGGGGHAGTVELTLDADEDDRLLHAFLAGETDAERGGTAILAQSVGGGGGSGGFNVSAGIAVGGNAAGNLGIGFGGAGGDGGDAGQVTLNANRGFVAGDGTTAYTIGDRVDGIIAQSVGGGGGNGAFNVTAGIAVTYQIGGSGNLGIGVGGFGGDGGHASSVIANLGGDVVTLGHEASGIILSSAGGGGGSGGFNVTGGIAVTAENGLAGNIGVGVGGFGGGGGSAGDILGRIHSNISTAGNDSFGLLTQSLGGGGGNGGFDVTGGISLSGGDGGAAGVLGVGVGGFGGDGGDSGAVDLVHEGDISTVGDASYGALVQSQAGGGGAGGFNVTGGIAAARGQAGALGFGLGGFGGGGGNASLVEAHLSGDISTVGDDAFGLVIQSVGGGGGAGGFNVTGGVNLSTSSNTAGINAGIGGFGGAGGNGGAVIATSNGVVVTNGVDADGVLAQSVGGAGGRGAFNITGGLGFTTKGRNIGVSLGLGGFGGEGGDASAVSLTRTGDTATSGAMSDGVVAQSIGGGGGSGGFNIAGQVSLNFATTQTTGRDFSGALGVGGFGGGGGNAGLVDLTVSGSVIASGSQEAEYASYSLDDVADEFGFTLPDQERPDLLTAGVEFVNDGAEWLFGPSSETGTAAESYELTERDWSGPFRVLADGSDGVVAQSIGGGGGDGGFNFSGNLLIQKPGTTGSGRSAVIGVGGFGGDGGDAAQVNLDAVGQLFQATGDLKSAVVAQSIGGGGGTGGFNVSGTLSIDGNATFGIGGFGSDGGLGGAVAADVDGDLRASGNLARGLLAQSIGGGGGAGGFNVAAGVTGDPTTDDASLTIGIGGAGGEGNRSGRVDVTQRGSILVDGFAAGGILAQSVGGGGGDGGVNLSLGVNASSSSGFAPRKGIAASVGIGGFAGDGADARDVVLNSNGDILVNYSPRLDLDTGELLISRTSYTGFNFGIRAQSIGGGGGNGGINLTGVATQSGQPLAVAVGGFGGSSGDAGDVIVVRGRDVAGTIDPRLIQVAGDYSVGLSAESIGGGGGRAGASFLLTGRTSDTNLGMAANILVGGNGGGAGSGGSVLVEHFGDIVMEGEGSRGLSALSVGGGGGSADIAVGTGYTAETAAVDVTIGGAPTAGGHGATVDVTHVGGIYTDGNDSEALLAQSLGGGGGNVALSLINAFSQSHSISFTLGRSGGEGGDGGAVTVDFGDDRLDRGGDDAGVLSTRGSNSTALFAQSVGGGGGISSATSLVVSGTESSGSEGDERVHQIGVSYGASGPNGGLGGDVIVFAQGQISTFGLESRGIHAQSIGGGGGRGGGALRASVNTTTSINVAYGGSGGNAGSSGNVLVENASTISTRGLRSDGILAESVGGGGGTGGYAIALGLNFPLGSILTPAETSNAINLNIGGRGGRGGNGGNVFVENTGVVVTQGRAASGVAARSTGGGGGSGGLVATVRAATTGEGMSGTVNVGGFGNIGGDAGQILVNNYGAIATEGDGSHGILAHSTGGGGGDAGLVANIDLSRASEVEGSGQQQRISFAFSMGGFGGDGGDGGDVSVNNISDPFAQDTSLTGVISTQGVGAHGIYARSISRGGGDGGSVISILGTNAGTSRTSYNAANLQVGIAIGGQGGSGGDAGNVTVVNSGQIQTAGAGSHGILAESVGGGGGNGGFALAGALNLSDPGIFSRSRTPTIAVGGFGGDGGNAGDVSVRNEGLISVDGTGSYGILATSKGGGGGSARLGLALSREPITMGLSGLVTASIGGASMLGAEFSSGGRAGDVDVVQDGRVHANGDGSVAVHSESINGGGGSVSMDFSDVNWIAGTPADSLDPNEPLGFSTGIGGQNVNGFDGGTVKAETSGEFVANGHASLAHSSASVGGGGGAYSLWVSVAETDLELLEQLIALPNEALGIDLDMGGRDGANNDGGQITASHEGILLADGLASLAIFDQSIGGGGGRSTVVIDTPDYNQFNRFALSMGGENGMSESGGDIQRTQQGLLATLGDLGPGGLLQSIGGGGGYSHAAFSGDGTRDLVASLSLGAERGEGLSGGAVNASFADSVMTLGAGSHGVLLQSIGAGGGFSSLVGGSDFSVSFGGLGSATGDGGDVNLNVEDSLIVEGRGAAGALLQSIGGGGGAVVTDLGVNSVALESRAGGIGDGGSVSVDIGGSVRTRGDASIGLIAMSAGGGGLTAVVGASSDDDLLAGIYSASAGGVGAGGDVDVQLSGDLVTLGTQSHGLLAQSLGQNGGRVSGLIAGDVLVAADRSHGVILQSIGGRGGFASGAFSPDFTNSATETAGDGGEINFAINGNLFVNGAASYGIIAQSLGGGGGWVEGMFRGTAGGAGRGGKIDLSIDGNVVAFQRDSSAIFAQSTGRDGGDDINIWSRGFVRGGSGTGRGLWVDGGADNVFTSAGSLSAISTWAIASTTGNDAIRNDGLVIGNIELGSGTNSFDNRTGSVFVAFDTIDLRDPETTGQALPAMPSLEPDFVDPVLSEKGQVLVMDGLDESTPASVTQQPVAPLTSELAIPIAENLSDAPAPAEVTIVANFGGAGSTAPAISNSQAVQSMTSSVSGAMSLDHTGVAFSPRPIAVALPLAGFSAGTKLPVQDVQRGQSVEATSESQPIVLSAINVVGGSKRPVQDDIQVTPLPAEQPAPVQSSKPDLVQVMATLDVAATPSIGLADQPTGFSATAPINAASFRNSGTFLMGLSASTYPIDLLDGATFGNLDGLGDPASNIYYGARVISTVELDGHFEQTADGNLVFDVAFGPYASDRINVTGSAMVAGTGDVTLTWLENADPVTLFATGVGGIDNGLRIRDTMAVDFSVAADAAGVHLLIDTDFGLPSLNRNGRALGGHMDSAIQAGGAAGIGRLLTLLGNMQTDQLDVYEAVFAELNPEPHVAVIHGQLASANAFAEDLFNCGSPVSRQTDECVWSRLELTEGSRDSSVEALSVETQSMRFTGGLERRLGHDWSVAAGVSYRDSSPTRTDDQRARTESQGFTLGIGVERNMTTGRYYGADVSAGWSWHDTERSVTVFEPGLGVSTPETGYARIGAHFGETVRHGSVFARPQISASLTALRHDGLVEEGLDGLGIEVLSDTQWVGSLNPQMTLGHIFRESDDMMGVVSLTGGVRLSSTDRLDLPMRFVGSNALAEPALIGSSLDELVYQVSADIEIAGNERVGMSIGYSSEFGRETARHRAGIDFRLRF